MNILTFDIEDWFHIRFDKNFNTEKNFSSYSSIIEKNTMYILEKLEDQQVKATFYCLGWVGKKYPKLIRQIFNRGHEIGSHSYYHNLLYNLNENEFREDLKKSTYTLENIIGKKINLFRAPAFSLTEKRHNFLEILINSGIKIDSSVFGASRDFGGNSILNYSEPFRIKYNNEVIKEFPMSYYNFFYKKFIFTGGGYYRFYPLWIQNIFLKNKSNYNLYYLHPRDFDKNQPLLTGLSPRRKFLSYYNLDGTKGKFEKDLTTKNFISISEADKLIDWSKTILHKL